MMKKYFQLLFFVLLLLVFNSTITAQTPTPTPGEVIAPPDLSNYKDWEKFHLIEFSMYIPQELKPSFEIGDRIYQNENFRLTIKLNRYQPNLSQRDRYKNSKKRVVFIGDIFTWIWSYDLDGEDFAYNQEILFYFKEDKYQSVSIYLSSKDRQKGKELAEKIFYSIKYEEELKEEKPKTEEPLKQIKREKDIKKPCEKL